jgi:hypothetical protein
MAEEEQDHEELADQLQKETDKLEQRSQGLQGEISDARQEWESKRSDPAVPGAVEPSDEDVSDSPSDSGNDDTSETDRSDEDTSDQARSDADTRDQARSDEDD